MWDEQTTTAINRVVISVSRDKQVLDDLQAGEDVASYLYSFGEWVVTTEGVVVFVGEDMSYTLQFPNNMTDECLEGELWRMCEKNWVDTNDFLRAIATASMVATVRATEAVQS